LVSGQCKLRHEMSSHNKIRVSMRFLYTLLLYIALPFVLFRLLLRSIKAPAYRSRWAERFGRFPSLADRSTIWIHAVSVGETQAAEPLVRQLMERYPHLSIVITTTTPTGSDRVRKLFGDSVDHVFFPYDLPFAVNGFIERARPGILLMMETEIWPNLMAACASRGIPTILANARLSERSARGYARLGSLTRETFERIGMVAAQAPADAERFLGLGVAQDRVRVTGSIKFDIRLPASLTEQAEVLRLQWGGRPVWVAASTHEGEDELILGAHQQVLKAFPQALLVLVPRHPERFERVATLLKKFQLNYMRRSQGESCDVETAVFLGDTMGELTLFLAASDAAFVGGSLIPVGGHNVLEPAALGIPVAFGTHMFNFALISRMLLVEQAAEEVRDESELAQIIVHWFGDASERARVGENGRRVVDANRGALERLLEVVDEELGSS
jgi:3-deoxy-D-manno-octulosonic-acid transferase